MIQISDTQYFSSTPIPSSEPLLQQPHTITQQTTSYNYYQHSFVDPTNNLQHTSPTPYTTEIHPKQLTTYILTLN